jgi:hypothetical protein
VAVHGEERSQPQPKRGNGKVSNARTVLRLAKPVGEMSNAELSALAHAALRTSQNNRTLSAPPPATIPAWPRLFARLDELARPLLSAGWTIVERSLEDIRWDQGTPIPPSAELSLTRADTRAHVELYEDGLIVVWPPEGAHRKTTGDPDPDIDPEQAYEPLTQNQAQELFRRVGLLP